MDVKQIERDLWLMLIGAMIADKDTRELATGCLTASGCCDETLRQVFSSISSGNRNDAKGRLGGLGIDVTAGDTVAQSLVMTVNRYCRRRKYTSMVRTLDGCIKLDIDNFTSKLREYLNELEGEDE